MSPVGESIHRFIFWCFWRRNPPKSRKITFHLVLLTSIWEQAAKMLSGNPKHYCGESDRAWAEMSERRTLFPQGSPVCWHSSHHPELPFHPLQKGNEIHYLWFLGGIEMLLLSVVSRVSLLHQQAAEVWWGQQGLLTASAVLRALGSLLLMWFGAVLKPLSPSVRLCTSSSPWEEVPGTPA